MATDADHDEGDGLNPVWLANNYLRRRKYDECIAICTGLLEKNPYDQVRQGDETRCTVGRRPDDPTPTPATALRETDPTLPSSTSPRAMKGGVVPQMPRADPQELDRRHGDRGGGAPPATFSFSNGQERIDADSTPAVLDVPHGPRASLRFCWTRTPPRRCPAREPPSCVPTPPPRGPTQRWRASRHSWRATRHRLCPPGHRDPAWHRQVRGGRVQGRKTRTTRPVTSTGRFVRLGTASMMAEAGGAFINVDKLTFASTPLARRREGAVRLHPVSRSEPEEGGGAGESRDGGVRFRGLVVERASRKGILPARAAARRGETVSVEYEGLQHDPHRAAAGEDFTSGSTSPSPPSTRTNRAQRRSPGRRPCSSDRRAYVTR